MPVAAEVMPDTGLVRLRDVPVFATCVDARGSRPVVYDAAKLRALLARGLYRQRGGYALPVHMRHHGGGDVQAAGVFRLTRVGSAIVGGVAKPTLFADLDVHPEVAEAVRALRLPYVSVELSPDLQDVVSVALLDHDAPFHEFELLRIKDFARRTSGRAVGACFARRVTMQTETDPKPPEAEGEKPAMQAEGMPGEDLAGKIAAAVAAAVGRLLDERLGGATPADDPGAMRAAPYDQPAPGAMRAAPTAHAREVAPELPRIAALAGRLDALEARLAKESAEQEVGAGVARLEAVGATPEEVATFRAFARASAVDARAYLAERCKGGATRGPGAWTGELPRPADAGARPELVEFCRGKPAAFAARANDQARLYDLARARGHTTSTLADWLRRNVDAPPADAVTA
jgi:hypothetical protein